MLGCGLHVSNPVFHLKLAQMVGSGSAPRLELEMFLPMQNLFSITPLKNQKTGSRPHLKLEKLDTAVTPATMAHRDRKVAFAEKLLELSTKQTTLFLPKLNQMAAAEVVPTVLQPSHHPDPNFRSAPPDATARCETHTWIRKSSAGQVSFKVNIKTLSLGC